MKKQARRDLPVIGFAGFSGSGKTTLIEKLIRIFRTRQIRVAVIKHDAHCIELDCEGKDTWRFSGAGAEMTVISSREKTVSIEQRERSLEELLEMPRDVDLVIVEGYKDASIPQIGIARKANAKGFPHETDRYLAVVSDLPVETDVPYFDLNDADGVADFIEAQILEKHRNP